jgi:hypothetical protein
MTRSRAADDIAAIRTSMGKQSREREEAVRIDDDAINYATEVFRALSGKGRASIDKQPAVRLPS